MFSLKPPRHIPTLPRLCENSDLELSRRTFVSITLNKKRTTLAGIVERRKERKQFCAFSTRGRFHTAWVNFDQIGFPSYVRFTPSNDRTTDIAGGPIRTDIVEKVGCC